MSTILDIKNPWRRELVPAFFANKNIRDEYAYFHVESGSKENARRIVMHEFPKKDLPYAEDMGKKAIEFTVRGYCICYPDDLDNDNQLYRRDYRIARNVILRHLEAEGPGVLQLPTLPPMTVVCPRYRLTEEEKFGGYCVFDMQFVELGAQPFKPVISVESILENGATKLQKRAIDNLNQTDAVTAT